jgi:hypothetical protein
MIDRAPELAKGVRSMGFVRPSKIQERALPLMLNDPYVIHFLCFENTYIGVVGRLI